MRLRQSPIVAEMRIVVLTGAGISAESGLRTFRASDGLWEDHRIDDVATPDGYRRNPALVHRFYNERRSAAAAAAPNAAHRAIHQLAKRHELTLVTQNVDDLHERAGSTDVIHMHGALANALCTSCGHRWPSPAVTSTTSNCPQCNHETVRPDIVWFGEIPYQMDEIFAALDRTEIFAAIGTSGNVYPAAGFAKHARQCSAECVELNLDRSAISRDFHRHLAGPATRTVPEWVAELI